MSILSKIKPNLLPYIHLGRFHKPIGTYLVYIPFTWGCALSYTSPYFMSIDMAIYFFSSLTLRAAACSINDFWDMNIDKKVERTKYRPLTSG